MHTLIRKEELSTVEIFWTRTWNKKLKEYNPLPHKPIRTKVHKVVYTDLNGNIVSKGYEAMKESFDAQINKACEGLDENLLKSFGLRAISVDYTKYSVEHTDDNIEYVGESTGKVKVLNI